MYLIYDTETTGLPKRFDAPITDLDNWPRMIQIAWQLHDEFGNVIEHQDYLVKPEGFNIPYDAEKIHGISTELAEENGELLVDVLDKFNEALGKTKFVVGQNLGFDLNIVGSEFIRAGKQSTLLEKPVLDTCTEVTANLLQLPGGRGGRFKLPTLTELHSYLFNEPFAEAHNATADVEATARCFFELIRKDVFTPKELQNTTDYVIEFKEKNPAPFKLIGLEHLNLKKESQKLAKEQKSEDAPIEIVSDEKKQQLKEAKFAHLHNHTQFSVLQSTIDIQSLVNATVKNKMEAVAMTDFGNMMGAFQFVSAVLGHNKNAEKKNAELIAEDKVPTETIIKPIVGCEFNICDNHLDKSKKDNGYQVVFLAKNKNGYHNLAKLASLAYTAGFYYVPRIDKKLVQQYKEDIIVLSGNLYGEIPSKILNMGEQQAEEALIWWKDEFKDDFYIELMRHGNQENERIANATLVKLANKHQVKIIATNNTFYIDKSEANAHDILLCVRDAEKQSTEIGRGRGYRYGLPNDEYYFKPGEEMKKLFADLPDAVINIQEIVDKIEVYTLYRDVLLPKFGIPEEFKIPEDELDGGKRGENKYLHYLTYAGAEKRYGELTPEIKERIDFELATIERTGYPGYFLIVQDFIAEARRRDVSVGPGRGSAAGSAVAYCLGITNIDPIKYDLLFERFLNPDRVSLPDIDIDFDDEGRSRVMDYVIEKYGASQVAQIITYGTMAAKSSIRDTARVLDLPLFEADRIAKLIPNMKLAKIFNMKDEELKSNLRAEEYEGVRELKNMAEGNTLVAETIRQAKLLEGSLRNTGIHACGVIITPDDITNFVPVTTAKDSDLYVTQFDNAVAESAGLLKMDFLGLKTLTLIKDTVKLIKHRTGLELDPDTFPIDDPKTYELFQRGETVGIFQYESPGMQKHLRELKPTVFGDLIAMNALYRPGPMEYIPSFTRRKHGQEPITYDLDDCQEYLEETYGITVYQEQVMLLSQKLADFTKGEADVLRKAMGKKQKDVLDKMKGKFIDQASAKGHDAVTLEKIWKDWEAFASYAFNKSHSTCYAWIAFQTAYLKAHYPAEYMAAVLSNNMNDLKQVTFFMNECKRMGLKVAGPDINESFNKFTVNENYVIRFGMAAIKGVGKAAVDNIVEERKERGEFTSIYDVVKRVDLRSVNKKTMEGLALAGAFDDFEMHRAQYFYSEEAGGTTNLEKLIKFGNSYQNNENSSQTSLFDAFSEEVELALPVIPNCEPWNSFQKLKKEKEVLGIYLTSHPLDDYKFEIQLVQNITLNKLQGHEESFIGRDLSICGIISNVQHRTDKNGNEFGSFTVTDYHSEYDISIFREDYLKFRHFLQESMFLNIRLSVSQRIFKDKDGNETGKRVYVNVTKMQLLTEILDQRASKLVLNIEVALLSDNIYSEVKNILDKYVGEKPLQVNLIYRQQKMQLALDARRMKVNICKELLQEFDSVDGITFALN